MSNEDLEKVVLYDVKEENGDTFKLSAYIDPETSGLVLYGIDFSLALEHTLGDGEEEFYYTFNETHTLRLKRALNAGDIISGLQNFFNGEKKIDEFMKLCKGKHIAYNVRFE